ncbi:hypothetical protein TorRG33x02_087900 [Trema orientale]|uniref:Uncharacterized protein n=1 Tax=Trema orientale TaxID=63057 RepID=A0A2P5FBV9_TREOI|nr:hypothetical protein TorRG33x02_087900 [Trema orientale]
MMFSPENEEQLLKELGYNAARGITINIFVGLFLPCLR